MGEEGVGDVMSRWDMQMQCHQGCLCARSLYGMCSITRAGARMSNPPCLLPAPGPRPDVVDETWAAGDVSVDMRELMSMGGGAWSGEGR